MANKHNETMQINDETRQLQIKTKRAPYKTNSIANIQSSDNTKR